MKLVMFLLAVGAIVAVVRIFYSLRKYRAKPESDWDSKMIEKLRTQGSDPFKPHEVVFFFGFPNEAAASRVVAQLERDGYAAESKHVPDNTLLPFSVHAQRAVRLSVSDMQATSRAFNALAETEGGRYDGWAASHNEREDSGGVTYRD